MWGGVRSHVALARLYHALGDWTQGRDKGTRVASALPDSRAPLLARVLALEERVVGTITKGSGADVREFACRAVAALRRA